jgi:transaldolase
VKSLKELSVKLFADGADMATMRELYKNPRIQGFTTNPTLMRKAGITNYEAFASEVLERIPDRPLSLEVFADDFADMERQARRLAKLGENVYVKIPVMNTEGQSSRDLICRLVHSGIKVNATALLTLNQVVEMAGVMGGGPPCYISVFAGRIADTGRDPVPMMAAAVEILRPHPNLELIWASPREVLNVFQADLVGCQVITATSDILKKLELHGKDLHQYSRETVQMFYEDACRSAYTL